MFQLFKTDLREQCWLCSPVKREQNLPEICLNMVKRETELQLTLIDSCPRLMLALVFTLFFLPGTKRCHYFDRGRASEHVQWLQ